MAQTPDAPAPQATQTEAGHEAGGQANFPPFDSATFPSQLLWLAIAFGALYWFMAKKALPKVGAAIEERKARIARDLDDATGMQQKAAAAAAAHEKSLAEGRRKALRHAMEARDALAAEAEAKRKTLEAELATKLAAAEARIAATREQAMTNVDAIAREATAAIVERLIGRPLKAEDVAAAVKSAKTE